MNRTEIRNRKKIEKRENFKENIAMIIIITIFLLMVAFFVFIPFVCLGYIISIGEFFSLKGVDLIFFLFVCIWGFLCMIFSKSL